MIDVQGICKIEGKNETIYNNIVGDALKHSVFSSSEEALASLAELARGKEGISINTQMGLNNDWGVEILLSAWKDDLQRVLNNPVYSIIFKPIQIVTSDRSIPGPNGTTTSGSQMRVVGLIKIKSDDTFFKWDDFDTDVIVGSVKAEGNINKRKLQHITVDKVYVVEACSKGPQNRFPFFEVDDRCSNAQEVSHSFPSFMDVVKKIYGEPISISEIMNHISDDGFDFKLVKGRVAGIKNPKQGKTSVSFNIGDASVTLEDLVTKKFAATLRVVTDINTVSSLGFGNGSYVMVLSKINKNDPRPGVEDDGGGLGVVAFYPALIYPVIRQNEDAIVNSPQTKGENATNVNKLLSAGKGIPNVQTPTTSVQVPNVQIPKTPVQMPKTMTPTVLQPPPTAEGVPDGITPCEDFGNPDFDNPGCVDCMNGDKVTFIACQKAKK